MPSKARAGLNQLLRNYPEAEIEMVDGQAETPNTEGSGPMIKLGRQEGPWVCVDLSIDGMIQQFAIWKTTGNVYHLQGPDGEYPGAVEDDPFIIVTPMGAGDGE
jgi:hypothetical protein